MAELAVVTQDILNSRSDMTGWPKERKLVWKLKEDGTKIETIAREVGFSRSQVSRLLNEDNFKPSEEFFEAIRGYLKKIGVWEVEDVFAKTIESSYVKSVNDLECIVTEGWKRCWYVLDATQKGQNFGMIAGPSGCGKTTAVRYWLGKRENEEKAILITANGCMTRKAILKRIAKAIGIWASADADTLIERICAELKERPRLIIIDEADQVAAEGKLEVLRTILDETNPGIVLIGNEDLSEYILRMAVDKRKLARIHNRFGAYQQIKMPTRDEALTWLAEVHMTQGARDRVVNIICRKGGDGGFRVARTMLSIIFDSIGDEVITEDILRSPALQGAVLSANA